jgi:predicted transposase YbfD/YdcC
MECSTILEQIVIPASAQEADAQTLYQVLSQVSDRRKRRGKRYEAALVLTLVLLAKMSGQKGMSGIAQWARLRIEWVRSQLCLARASLPCGNTYQNVCDHIDLGELNQRLADFFAPAVVEERLVDEPPAAAPQRLRHWVLDGKCLRGSHRPARGQEAQSVLSLYDVQNQHVVAQRELAGKGHERKTALALVQELDLHGVLLSADALHTQPAWCMSVRCQGGDYLLIAKANQRLLRSDIALLFSEDPRPWLPEQSAYQVNQGHGRTEVRTLRSSRQLNAYIAPKWCDVAQVFQLQRRITRQRRTTTETVYGITSLTPQVAPPKRLLHLIRQHWQIENRLHWRRDVTLGEDSCTVSRGQTPLVLATLNNVILALVDRLGVSNLAAQQRIFDARPIEALDLILHPI